MAKRIFTSAGLTFTASAAGSVATTSAYMALKGGSSTQLIDILEVLVSGKAAASAVGGFVLKRASTIETTPTTLAAPHSDGPMHPSTAALGAPAVSFVAAATQPTPSNTVSDGTLNLGLNSFGGIIRWNAAPTQQFSQLGNTASLGESVLFNSSTAGGATAAGDAHIVYEPY